MRQLCRITLLCLAVMAALHNTSEGRRGSSGSFSKGSSSSSKGKSKGASPNVDYPMQPTVKVPAGSKRGGSRPGGYANQYPAGGSYPAGGQYPGHGGSSPGGYPNQYPSTGGNPAAGGYPNQYPGRGGVNPGGYPNQYPAGGGYPVSGQYPARGGASPGGYPNQYPAGGGFPAAGGYPVRTGSQPGGFPGGYPSTERPYPNWNPNNKILSPRYGGGFGGAGHGIGGSPFSRSVHNMGYEPSLKSKGFAKKAMVAAGVGAVAGMAVGYGLGRFPKPHFSFNSPQEERYYNHYMYRNYGTKSTDKNDYSRDYVYKPPPEAQSYEKYMNCCMNRTDLLQDRDMKIRREVARSPDSKTKTLERLDSGGGSIDNIQRDISIPGSPALETGTLEGTDNEDRSIGNVQKDASISESPALAKSTLDSILVPAGLQEMDDDTVSITEIGYPALIQQIKARKCVQLYMEYSESFLQKQTAPTGPSSSSPRLLPCTFIIAISSALLVQ